MAWQGTKGLERVIFGASPSTVKYPLDIVVMTIILRYAQNDCLPDGIVSV